MARHRDIDISLLRSFLSVVDSGSMTAASSQMHVTQGGLSLQIKRLEAALGITLLERDFRGTRLTASGQRLLPMARKLLAMNDDIHVWLSRGASPTRIRIGLPHDMLGAYFSPMLKRFADDYPEVEIDVVSGSSVELMRLYGTAALDLVISQCPIDLAQGERLAQEGLVWIHGGNNLAERRPLPVCFVTDQCTFRSTAFRLLSARGIAWRETLGNSSAEATLAAVRSGLAVTPWLRSLVPKDLHVLPAGELPDLPDFAIELTVLPGANPEALALAEIISDHHR